MRYEWLLNADFEEFAGVGLWVFGFLGANFEYFSFFAIVGVSMGMIVENS